MDIEQESPLQTNLSVRSNQQSNHVIMSNLFVRLLLIAATVKSILGLVILLLLFLGSVTALIIGFHFRHSHQCPIEPRISLFLVIAGSISIEWIILSFILSIITVVRKHIQSLRLVRFIIFTALIIIITNIFLIVWVVFGSIWTLTALDTVQYNTPHLNTFCQQTLYQFTLGYLVVTYILTTLQCWYRLCIIIYCSIQNQN